MAWENGAATVYHGTDGKSAQRIFDAIDLTVCRRLGVDFGPGFYVTTFLIEAWHWAQIRAKEICLEPAVVMFDLDRDAIARLGDHLAFTLPDADFYDFVEYNRDGHPHHARRGDHLQNPPLPPQYYDVVYGPVARYPERGVYAGWSQICLISEKAVKCLVNARILWP